MTLTVSTIVEGHGEVQALPLLLRRIGQWLNPDVYIDVPAPIRVQKDRFLNRDAEFRRHVTLAANKCGPGGWILILLDADDDCPAARGAEILARANECLPRSRISVVLANREYEAWFIAAARSLHGHRGFTYDPLAVVDPETPRNAKLWVDIQMGAVSYGEVIDQPAFSARMDLQQAYDGSRSFRKLCKEWAANVVI